MEAGYWFSGVRKDIRNYILWRLIEEPLTAMYIHVAVDPQLLLAGYNQPDAVLIVQ